MKQIGEAIFRCPHCHKLITPEIIHEKRRKKAAHDAKMAGAGVRRSMLLRRVLGGERYVDIGKELGCSVTAISAAVNKAASGMDEIMWVQELRATAAERKHNLQTRGQRLRFRSVLRGLRRP